MQFFPRVAKVAQVNPISKSRLHSCYLLKIVRELLIGKYSVPIFLTTKCG